MARYDYRCEACRHVTEEVQGYEVRFVPCPSCGGSAERLSVYLEQTIRGATVAKGRYCKATRAGNVTDKHGRTRLSLFEEATQEIAHAENKADAAAERKLPRPSLYKAALGQAEAKGATLRGRRYG